MGSFYFDWFVALLRLLPRHFALEAKRAQHAEALVVPLEARAHHELVESSRVDRPEADEVTTTRMRGELIQLCLSLCYPHSCHSTASFLRLIFWPLTQPPCTTLQQVVFWTASFHVPSPLTVYVIDLQISKGQLASRPIWSEAR